MPWEHFDIRRSGSCMARIDETGEILTCDYETGIISTGKTRVFWGYQIIIRMGWKEIIGRSKGYSETYALALKDCTEQLAAMGITLLVAGNSADYSESALSGGSGYGYLEGKQGGVHLMSSMDNP